MGAVHKVGHLLSARRRAGSRHGMGGFAFQPHFDYSYDGAMRSYEDSLQRLGLDHIDILYIHDVDIFTHGDRYREVSTPRWLAPIGPSINCALAAT